MEADPTQVLGVDPLRNYTDQPLVSVILACHSGDVHLLDRALRSVENQLPLGQLEVVIAYDGDPGKDEKDGVLAMATIEEATRASTLPIKLCWSETKSGYYCVPRNKATTLMAWGLYIANLDADNEWREGHLRGLLAAIRSPLGSEGWPHFTYSLREYVKDEGASDKVPVGVCQLIEWTPEAVAHMKKSPYNNFIDTGDFLIGRSALYELAERTGCMWNSECRRFGDWDLVARMADAGYRGRLVPFATHVYHWTGQNLQVTRKLSDIVMIPPSMYQSLKDQGLVRKD